MKVLIMAAADLPIPAYKGGATETIVTDFLNSDEVQLKKDFLFDVFSHCKGNDFNIGNVSYYFFQNTLYEKVMFVLFRVLRIILLKKIYIPDFFPYRTFKSVDLSSYDVIIIEGNMRQIETMRKKYKGKLLLHIHTVMTMTDKTPRAYEIFNKCDAIIANSLYAQKTIQKINPQVKSKVLLCKNCIDLNLYKHNFHEFRKNFRKQNNITDNAKVFIFCGRLEKGKGVLELIKAFKKLQNDSFLIIVGSSWFSSDKTTKYINKIKKESRDVKERIIFTGYIKHNDIGKYYQIADIAVMPSVYEEAAGLVALEAQASGLPIIISDAGGIKEYIHSESVLIAHLGSNFIMELAELMDRLCIDSELYKT